MYSKEKILKAVKYKVMPIICSHVVKDYGNLTKEEKEMGEKILTRMKHGEGWTLENIIIISSIIHSVAVEMTKFFLDIKTHDIMEREDNIIPLRR